MKKKKVNKPTIDFVGYEEARKKSNDTPVEVSEKAVKAATNRINPDENTNERG